MKRFLFAIACVVLFASCNNEIELSGQDSVFEFRENSFSGVGVQDNFELYLSNGTEAIIKIEADENIINAVKYEIKQGILYFYQEAGTEFPTGTVVKIYITKDSLNTIKASAAKVYLTDTLRNETIDLNFSKASILEGKVTTSYLRSFFSNATIKLGGTADKLYTNITNGSLFDSYSLALDTAKINISGSSSANITVNKEIELEAIDGSVLNYKGNPIIRSMYLEEGSKMTKN